jgi:hypothetical protein
VTPVDLVTALHRPLGEWLPGANSDAVLARLVVLDSTDQLTDETYEIGWDYTVELLAEQEDPGTRWLPAWRVHRIEQIEGAAFHALRAGTDEDYARGRRFLVEHPAGSRVAVLTARNELGIPPLTAFEEIPFERRWRDWWWGCPTCRWPMRVRSQQVQCDFPRHEAAYLLSNSRSGAPSLHPLTGGRRSPRAQPVDGAVCVDESVWRYIVVPGVVEVRLRDRIAALPGVRADLYPQKDLYDIRALPEDGDPPPWDFALDVKDFASARALARKLTERPIAAGILVLPRYRRNQLDELRRLLPEISVATEDSVHARIKRTSGGAR